MSQLLNSYPIFEGNQVLTSSQLNELVAYLDEQNRLTRAKLIGNGICCGLEISLGNNPVTKRLELIISKGLGLTSQGYLMSLGECLLTQYKEYFLPDGGTYAPFVDPDTGVQDVQLFEMLTPDYIAKPGETVLPISSPTGFLNDKVVMLFLEMVDDDQKSCLGKRCDDEGQERIFTLRKLLVSKLYLDNFIFPRTCSQTFLFSEKYDLPEVIISRVLFDPAQAHSSDYFKFSENYVNAIKANKFIGPSVPTRSGGLYEKLFDALRQTYVDFRPILEPVYGNVNPFAGYPLNSWSSFINGSTSSGPKYLGMQYFYDFIKDIILAYNEFRNVAFDLMSECCPSLDCFPRHLLLGEVIPVESTCKPSEYRHYFVAAQVGNHQKDVLDRTIMLHKRIVLMLSKFNLAIINNPNPTPVQPSQLGEPLFITPSNEKRDPLSERAIPHYYKIHELDIQLNTTLEKNWNFEFNRHCLFSKGLLPLAYGNQDIVQANDQGPIKTPWYYDQDQRNFLRIETPLRQNYVAVTNELKSLQKRFNLPFNIVTLRLGGPPLDDITKRCEFDDLRSQYLLANADLRAVFTEVFNRFGTIDKERVAVKSFPTFLTRLVADSTTQGLMGSVTQTQIGVTTGNAGVPPSPIFAPQRNLQQVLTALGQDLFNLLNTINTITTSFLPFDISQFNFGYTGAVPNSTPGFIQNYISAVQFAINVKVDFNQLMDLITHNLKTRYSAELYFTLGRYMDEVLGVLEKLITDLYGRNLSTIYYLYQYRLQKVRENDPTLFSNFLKQNPGMEHQAGVHRGDTYVMVVTGNAAAVDVPDRDFVVNMSRERKAKEIQKAQLQSQASLTPQDVDTIHAIDADLLFFSDVSLQLAVGVPIQKIQLEPTQVIADFTLPYLCCCDCECDIPHPTQLSNLGIPVIAYPFYAQYSPGDYAYGESLFMNRHSGGNAGEVPVYLVDVLPACEYEKNEFTGNEIRLYIVNREGVKVAYTTVGTDKAFADYALTPTTNYPNDPGNVTQYGNVSVRVFSSGVNPIFVYAPVNGFRGVDSFFYMFEIVVPGTTTVLRRSTIGEVTIQTFGG
ncbi:MAG: hypothetical protein IAF38_19535 [Bacteroidia bacterium]|nr:hypothetical protein [Bacteroidia bacterium]